MKFWGPKKVRWAEGRMAYLEAELDVIRGSIRSYRQAGKEDRETLEKAFRRIGHLLKKVDAYETGAATRAMIERHRTEIDQMGVVIRDQDDRIRQYVELLTKGDLMNELEALGQIVDRLDAILRKLTLTKCLVCNGDSWVGEDNEGDPIVCDACHGTGWLNQDELATLPDGECLEHNWEALESGGRRCVKCGDQDLTGHRHRWQRDNEGVLSCPSCGLVSHDESEAFDGS